MASRYAVGRSLPLGPGAARQSIPGPNDVCVCPPYPPPPSWRIISLSHAMDVVRTVMLCKTWLRQRLGGGAWGPLAVDALELCQ